MRETIKLTEDKIVEWSKGNPGAIVFLIQIRLLTTSSEPIAGELILNTLENCESIRGTNLYVLYSDLCNKNMVKVYGLCLACPNDELEDACSRQDYSGRELIKQYL